ncbi:MAG: hypothetical protein AAB871_01750 [Patescibacteria group bacterium]
MPPKAIIILIAILIVLILTIGALTYFFIFQKPAGEEPPAAPVYEAKTSEEISQSLTAPEDAGQAEIQKNVSKKLSPPRSGGEMTAADILENLAPAK